MTATLDRTRIFQDGDSVYLLGPVSPFQPGASEIEEFAFAADLKRQAPNDNLLWLKGNYVEADRPNANGHEWTADELSIKSLTPNFCPVTVMHDPRTAVGVIADTRLLTPEKDGVERARIATVLAIWAHRFPEVAAEALHNYENGELMQSMECMSPFYSCGSCGRTFHKLPEGREEAQWCEHLAETPNARRILGGVTFTGTGLIFGSLGARGAYSEAHLETAVKQEIVAAHQQLHTPSKPHSEPSRSKRTMDIDQAKYDELMARPTKEEFASVQDERDTLRDEKAAAERKVEEAEIAQKAAEKERDDLKVENEKAEEKARQTELASERMGKLGKDFREALGDNITTRLEAQAKELKDDEWEARLVELEELTSKKREEGGAGEATTAKASDGNVSIEETASARLGGGSGGAGGGRQANPAGRSAVIGNLTKRHYAGSAKS